MRMWLCTQLRFPFSSFIKCITIYALFPNYYCTKYIDNYSNTASGIPACLGLFVSCLSDRLVDIVSDLPLLSLGIIIANPSLSGIGYPFCTCQWHFDQFLKPPPLLCE